ncbi:MAG TPA: hypothetical protein VHQ41_03840 [Patescibacteria group bacterium]|jgi:Tfp pilus assembly protein PilN|nr:hypothetical protein [Patescibacteria group bacterium]
MKRINLLPKPKQRELAGERVLYGFTVTIIISVVILLLGALVQFGVWAYLNQKVKSSEVQIEQLKRVASKSENAEIKGQIIKVNGVLQDFTTLLNKSPQWSVVLTAFVKDVPNGVRITELDADATKKEVSISGFSPTRDAVIDLYNSINADKDHFININYPLENVTQPTDVKFNFTFNIADGVLSKGDAK